MQFFQLNNNSKTRDTMEVWFEWPKVGVISMKVYDIDLIDATTKPMFSGGQETGPRFKNKVVTYWAC